MVMTRIVSLPLSRDPEILWGLRLQDLMWIVMGAVADLGIWHLPMAIKWRLAFLAMTSGISAGLAWIRISERTVPEWLGLLVWFYISPRSWVP